MAGIVPKKSSTQGATPTTGQMIVGEIAVNSYDGKLFLRGDNGSPFVREIGPGKPTLTGIKWSPVAGLGPVSSYEFDDEVLLFAQGQTQTVSAFIRVPTDYVGGRTISLKIGVYSPGTSNNIKIATTTSLVRKNTDAINSTSNQYNSPNGDQALSTANKYFELSLDLCSSAGLINGVAVSAGDILRVDLKRGSTAGADDANDVRVLPNTTEIVF